MQKNNSTNLAASTDPKKNNYRAPSVFAIPPNVYSGEMEKDRDRNLYLKIQKLEKDSQLLREELGKLEVRKEEMVHITLSLLLETRAVKSNCDQRKAVLQQVIKATQLIVQIKQLM